MFFQGVFIVYMMLLPIWRLYTGKGED